MSKSNRKERENMKKKVIWGTGMYGGRFVKSLDEETIDFFIDQDKKKEGKIFCGRRIRNPEQINNDEWKELYLYIPENYYTEISIFLREKGLKESVDFQAYGHKIYISKKRADLGEKQYKEKIRKITKIEQIPIFATYWEKHGYENYFRHISDILEKYIVISERPSQIEGSNDWFKAIDAPLFADYETFIDIEDYEIDVKYNDVDEMFLDEITQHLQGYFPEKEIKKCRYNAWRQYKYIIDTLDILNCKKVIAFSSVTVGHSILQKICNQRGIEIIYTHPGMIHGTLAFDAIGEVGESVPALFAKKFKELPVSKEEVANAVIVREYLKKSRLNRKVQPKKSTFDSIKLHYKDRPVVFFAGQNDVGSFMVPYNERAKNYFSPIFSSSIEAAVYLAELCEKNQWNFIFKPHPMYVHKEDEKRLPSKAHYIEYADINDVIDASDVVITILSTTNYDAIIRDKPVVVLGCMWSKEKGFNYEAFERDEIEKQIKNALEHGLTNEMKEMFLKHLAQSLKYYLYDNGEDREIRYGQRFPDSFDGFFDLYNMLKD